MRTAMQGTPSGRRARVSDRRRNVGFAAESTEKAAVDDDRSALEVDRSDGVLDQRHEAPVLQLEVVVRRTGMDCDHASERVLALVDDDQPDELERVVRVGLGAR
jgi:hypothetical protein